ncbi:peptidyl-tRNA hydrolase [Nocardioides aurantiacus]|uniref:peptidyl-tRNA hydrolase n=1 Tax=Nocardioides aurantiacus TaxID=86796 RepID=UPI0014770372|nr:peptidyl-tRNA hydrolase [Nocardioides aurantiacus]
MTYSPDEREGVPWAMQVVVRVEKDPAPEHLAVLRSTASAVALALAAFTAPEADDEVRARAEEWRSGPIRKVVRRARGAGWTRQLAVPGVLVHAGEVDVAVHVPGRVDEVDPEIARLQVGGLTLEGADAGVEAPVDVVLNPRVAMTTGKAAAQVGHAAQLVLQALPPETAAAWLADGAPVTVRTAADDEWERLLATAPVVVADGGFTEVAPGTVTVVATHGW